MRYLVVIAAMLVFTVPARADWAYTKWGMTPEQVIAASKGTVTLVAKAKRKKLDASNLETIAEGTHTDGSLKLRTSFQFDTRTGGLACVMYAPQNAAQDEALKKLLTQQYGEPQKSGLAAVGLETLAWRKPADEINMEIVDRKISYVLHCKPSK